MQDNELVKNIKGMKKMKISLIEIASRLIKWDKKMNIYLNGVDNLYPNRANRFRNNSVTAKMSSEIMTQFLIGRGLENIEDFIIDPITQLSFFDLTEDIARSIVDNKGVFIWVNYNGNLKFDKAHVVPFSSCRIGIKDSNDYNGKILVKKDWGDSKEQEVVVDVYNPNEEVIKSQIKRAKGIEKYKGQILYYNCERQFYYPTSRIDAVLHDCDSEAQSSTYKNQLLRKGFFGKTMFVTRPLIDESINKYVKEDGKKILNKEYIAAETEADNLRKQIKEFLGAEKAGGAMLIETDFDGDKMKDWFQVETVESKINPDLFINVENSLRENILIAHNNLPKGLIMSSESMFSNSGEAIQQMKTQYWESTEKERAIFIRLVNEFLKNWKDEPSQEVTVKPLIVKDETNHK